MKPARIAILPGDGIGPEVVAEAVRVLKAGAFDWLQFEFVEAPIGGAALEANDDPLPPRTLAAARSADAILFGAVGDPRFDTAPRAKRPEQGLLRLRQELGLFANLRPATVFPGLEAASTLKPEVISDEVEIKDVSIVGRYALNFRWSDGHETGIYSFQYLRDLCDAIHGVNV